MAPTATEAQIDSYLTPSKSRPQNPRKKTITGTIVNAFKTRVTGFHSAADPSINNLYQRRQDIESTHELNIDRGSQSSIVTPAVLQGWDDADDPTPDMKNISSTTTLKVLQQQRLQEHRDLSLPTFPAHTSARPSTVNTASKQLKFYMAGGEGGVDAASSPSVPDNASVKSGAAVSIKKQWSFSERFFYSGDDQSVSVSDQPSWESNNNCPHNQPALTEKNHRFPVNAVPMIDRANGDRDGGNDDNTIHKAQRRSKKVSRASTVNAFVIFLKALFGVGMLSKPAVLGEVGLLLGTFCHLLIVVGCAFACYLLLSARQYAKIEVMENQHRDEERREIYEMWRMKTRRRAVVRMRRREELESSRTVHQNNASAKMTVNSSVAMVPDGPKLLVLNAGRSTANDNEFRMDPMLLSTVNFSSSDINAEIATQSHFAAAPSCGNVQINNESLNSKSSNDRGRSNWVTDEYRIFIEDGITPPPPPPPPKPAQVRLITYGDVAKCLIGKQASMFIVLAMVTGHIMFASGLLHLAIENLCYVVGWERLGWSYTQVYVEEDVDDRAMMRRLGHSQDEGGEHNNPNHSNDYASRSSDEEEYYFEWKGPDFIGKITLLSTPVTTVDTFPRITYPHSLTS
jgi:hypothetical protein